MGNRRERTTGQGTIFGGLKILLRRRPQFNVLQQINYLRRPGITKNPVKAFKVDVSKGWLEQQTGVHRAVPGQVVDDLIDEPDLGGRVDRVVQELTEGLAGRLAIQSHQLADSFLNGQGTVVVTIQ